MANMAEAVRKLSNKQKHMKLGGQKRSPRMSKNSI